MPAIHVRTDGNHPRTGRELGADRLPIIHTTKDWTLDALRAGMQSGATSLMLLIPADVDGDEVLLIAETSLTCFINAATTLAAAFRDEVERPGYAVLSPAAQAVLQPRFVEAIRRAIPLATHDQAVSAAELLFTAIGADAPRGGPDGSHD